MFKGIAIVASLAALAVAGTAAAGNGGASGKSSSSSISLVVPRSAAIAAASTSASAHYGDEVTFDVATTATDYPYVNLKCFQNGTLIGEGWEGFFAGALGDQMFTLSAPQWSGGAADCTATLNKHTKQGWQVLASTSFHVDA